MVEMFVTNNIRKSTVKRLLHLRSLCKILKTSTIDRNKHIINKIPQPLQNSTLFCVHAVEHSCSPMVLVTAILFVLRFPMKTINAARVLGSVHAVIIEN
jgi:hypothetical protein